MMSAMNWRNFQRSWWIGTLAAVLVAVAGSRVHGQCSSTIEAEAVIAAIFDDSDDPLDADVNGDGLVTVADVSAALESGQMCPTVTPTPTATATLVPMSPTRRFTSTPTATSTPAATATPTAICVVQNLAVGATNGALAPGDCIRTFRGQQRLADEYDLIVPAGEAVSITVTATMPGNTFAPYVRIIDPNGFFGINDGGTPVEFSSTTTQPYRVIVSSVPAGATSQQGPYRIDVATRACTTRPLQSQPARFDGSECPAPYVPTRPTFIEPVDTYTFDITKPLTLVTITMRQPNEESLLDPILTVIGPDGHEIFLADDGDDASPTGFGFDAQARFLATQLGSYTVFASGQGCTGTDPEDDCRYILSARTDDCTSTEITAIPTDSRKSISGILYGDTSRTRCATALSVPGKLAPEVPAVGSPADLYTFSANAGDTVTIELESEEAPIVYLFGPAGAGTPLVGVDTTMQAGGYAQIGAALNLTGTYTIVAATRNQLPPPDPEDPGDEGESSRYTLFIQKCPNAGVIGTGASVNGQFGPLDCGGKNDVPVRSHIFNGTAGELLTVEMASTGYSSALTLVEPGGNRVSASTDPFDSASANARVVRMLPVTGTYVLEASLESDSAGAADRPSYRLSASTCGSQVLAAGTVSGQFSPTDCDLGGGRRYDVFRGVGSGGGVASFGAASGGCVLALLPDGGVVPESGCFDGSFAIPLESGRPYGLIVADDAGGGGSAYQVGTSICTALPLGYSAEATGSIDGSDCLAGDGRRVDYVRFAAPAGLVRFGDGVATDTSASFASTFTLHGSKTPRALSSSAMVTSGEMVPLGGSLAGLVEVGAEPGAQAGTYRVRFGAPIRIN